MSRLIDADALEKKAMSATMYGEDGWPVDLLAVLLCDVELAPTVEAEPVRHGRWEECDYVKYDGHGECIHYPKAALRCSCCCNAFKKELLWKRNYCPNCGAKMDKEEA